MEEAQFLEMVKRYDHVIIYGAGMVGGLVFERLRSNSLLECLLGFAVTEKAASERYYGRDVYGIGELESYKGSAVVIIATMSDLQDEIARTLSAYGFAHVLPVDEVLFRDMEERYIQDFAASHPIVSDHIDVLFMASDNDRSSGAFLCMADLNADLNSRGISTLVVLPEYGNGESVLLDKGISYTYVASQHWAVFSKRPEWRKKRAAMAKNEYAVERLERMIERYHVKILHNNTTYTYVGAVAAHRKGIPVVWHMREDIRVQGFEFVQPEYAAWLMNQSVCIIAVSRYIRSCLDKLDPDRVRVVYDGVDVERYYIRRPVFCDMSLLHIVMVGAVAAFKGQREMIDAAYILKQRGFSQFFLQIIGKGREEYVQELEQLVDRYQMKDQVQFLGRQDDVQAFYSRADIAVVSSPVESFGRVTVEAQLAGCLVIGVDSGATAELIADGRTGFLYQHGNSEDLANKIISAARQPGLSRKVALAGQESARASYTKERTTKEMMCIYKSILQGEDHDGRFHT